MLKCVLNIKNNLINVLKNVKLKIGGVVKLFRLGFVPYLGVRGI